MSNLQGGGVGVRPSPLWERIYVFLCVFLKEIFCLLPFQLMLSHMRKIPLFSLRFWRKKTWFIPPPPPLMVSHLENPGSTTVKQEQLINETDALALGQWRHWNNSVHLCYIK